MSLDQRLTEFHLLLKDFSPACSDEASYNTQTILLNISKPPTVTPTSALNPEPLRYMTQTNRSHC